MAERKPLVLLIDEIDTLVGDTLLSVLRQLRSGYDQRPAAFPHSTILCGVRDVREYRIHTPRPPGRRSRSRRTTRALRERLANDRALRRLCGWESIRALPSEATFSRAFAEFAEGALPSLLTLVTTAPDSFTLTVARALPASS